MVLSRREITRVRVYMKHYSMISLQILSPSWDYQGNKKKHWEVYYRIHFMDGKRPLYMYLARCKSKQLAAVKISEIEDYVAGDKHICITGNTVNGASEDCEYYPHIMPEDYVAGDL